MASNLAMIGTLLVRPLPMFGEGLRGYLLRVADVNGLLPEIDLHAMVEFSGHRGNSDVGGSRGNSALGLSESAIAGLACLRLKADGTRRTFLGHTIASGHLRTRQCAVCPECLSTTSACWADWELKAQVACPEHRRWLIDVCPRCEQQISWRRGGVCTCLCGFDLRRAKPASASRTVVDIASVVRHRLFGDLASKSKLPGGLPPFIGTCDLNELLGAFHLFRACKLRKLVEAPLGAAGGSTLFGHQAAVAMAVAATLGQWPAGWNRMLDELAEAAAARAVGGSTNGLLSAAEALAPFYFLMRQQWSAASAFPVDLADAVTSRLARTKVYVGTRRLYAAKERTDIERGELRRGLSHLHWRLPTVPVRHALATDRLTKAALGELFTANADQLRTLRSVGLLPRASWATVSEVNDAFGRLAATTRGRKRSGDFHMTPLSELECSGDNPLARRLEAALAGNLQLACWTHLGTYALSNLFVDDVLTGLEPSGDRKGTRYVARPAASATW